MLDNQSSKIVIFIFTLCHEMVECDTNKNGTEVFIVVSLGQQSFVWSYILS